MPPEFVPSAAGLALCVQPIAGIVGGVAPLTMEEPQMPEVRGVACQLGSLGHLYPPKAGLRGSEWYTASGSGSAIDENPALANTRAVAEALERYASMVVLEEEVLLATADELGEDALDLDTVPRCSDREYADSLCPVQRPRKDLPIRWVKSLRLSDGRPVWVPLVMSHLYIQPRPGERFWLQISTGVAAHTDPIQAIVSAAFEVIERDAVALTWLARLPLPEVQIDPADFSSIDELTGRSGCGYRIFDATTDLGFPTMYGIQERRGHKRLAQVVACATGTDPAATRRKTIRELIQLNWAIRPDIRIPDKVDDFSRLPDGMTYMADATRSDAFDFLLANGRRRPLAGVAAVNAGSPSAILAALRARLGHLGMEAFVVDLTTDDVRRSGLWVMRVVIPALMPMSTVYRCRYLGHPRLYDYARQVGLRDFAEEQVNTYPQPFA